jgi:hypothetical protein
VIILDDAGAVHPDGGLNWSLGPSFAGKDIKLRVLGHAGKQLHPRRMYDSQADVASDSIVKHRWLLSRFLFPAR